MLIGDEKFLDYWENSRSNLSMSSARDLLKWLMELVEMPAELTGNLVETRYLLNRFSLDLHPWPSFLVPTIQLVQVAFPNQSLLETTCLARQVHQFRYVISAFQSQWVRQHFLKKQTGSPCFAIWKEKRWDGFGADSLILIWLNRPDCIINYLK